MMDDDGPKQMRVCIAALEHKAQQIVRTLFGQSGRNGHNPSTGGQNSDHCLNRFPGSRLFLGDWGTVKIVA